MKTDGQRGHRKRPRKVVTTPSTPRGSDPGYAAAAPLDGGTAGVGAARRGNMTLAAIDRIANECSQQAIDERCASLLTVMREIYGDDVVDEAMDGHSIQNRWHLRIVR